MNNIKVITLYFVDLIRMLMDFHIKLQNFMNFQRFLSLIKYDVKTDVAF